MNTTESTFPLGGWYGPPTAGVSGDMKREIHGRVEFQTGVTFLISYYFLITATTYCGTMTCDDNGNSSGNLFGGVYNDDRVGTLPHLLTKFLSLETISEE